MSCEHYSTLWNHLSCLEDPRSPRGQQFEWTYILSLLGAAMLAGQESMLAISQWVSMNSAVFIETLQPRRKRVPSYATLRRALCQLDIEAFEELLAAFTKEVDGDDQLSGRIETQDGSVLWGQSIDGKTLRGASAHGEKIHLVSLVRHESGTVLAQAATTAGIDEPKTAKAMLNGRTLANTVTTMDALYTERELTEQILAAGGAYLMVVKKNQRTLYRDIDLAFSVLPPPQVGRKNFGATSDSRSAKILDAGGPTLACSSELRCSMTISTGQRWGKFCVAPIVVSGTIQARSFKRCVMASPTSRPHKSRWPKWHKFGVGTGQLKTVRTTFETSRLEKTVVRFARATHPRR